MKAAFQLTRILIASLIILALTACNLPQFVADQVPTIERPSDTPNATLTEIFAIVGTLTAVPTMTLVPPTATPLPPTQTPLPSATATNTTVPSPTLTATLTKVPTVLITAIPGRAVIFTANYLSTPPTIDGVWDEWTSTQYPMTNLIFGSSNWTGEADLEGSFRIGWDNQYLYLAVKVKDDVYVQNSSGTNLYKGDQVELLLDTNLQGDFYYNVLSPDDYQLGLSPGKPDTNGTKEAYLYFPSSLAGQKSGVTIAAVSQAGVYRMEAKIPWSLFNTTPAVGSKYGFAVRASDNDNGGENVQQSMVSCLAGNVLGNPTTWAELRLK